MLSFSRALESQNRDLGQWSENGTNQQGGVKVKAPIRAVQSDSVVVAIAQVLLGLCSCLLRPA